MILISERNEWLANKLVNANSDMIVAGVVVGNNPGEVWVDNKLNPSSAIVWSSGLESFNFMGSARNNYFNQSIKTLIDNEIIPFLRNKNLDSFEFSVDSEDWYPPIYQFLGNRKLDESSQMFISQL